MLSPKKKAQIEAVFASWDPPIINVGKNPAVETPVSTRVEPETEELTPFTKTIIPTKIKENDPLKELESTAVTTPDLSDRDVAWNNPTHKRKILDSMIMQESGGNPNTRDSRVGARGIAQVMPKTWGDAIKYGWVSATDDPRDPKKGLLVQEKYMDWLMSMDSVKSAPTETERIQRAVAAYNGGIGTLQNAIAEARLKGGTWLQYVPDETKKYVPEVINRFLQTKNSNYTNTYGRNTPTMKFGGILFKQ